MTCDELLWPVSSMLLAETWRADSSKLAICAALTIDSGRRQTVRGAGLAIPALRGSFRGAVRDRASAVPIDRGAAFTPPLTAGSH